MPAIGEDIAKTNPEDTVVAGAAAEIIRPWISKNSTTDMKPPFFAAGFYKSDFQVKVKGDLLMISASKEESEIVDNPSMKRQEFDPRGFKRIFELNEKIDKENITATYQEGRLKNKAA
jgi:hypothetical protein